MDDKQINQLIKEGRNFMHNREYPDFVSDQDLKKPQPPLTKAKMTDDEAIKLPTDFADLNITKDFIDIINQRKSSRVYTGQGITLLELSFLLWSSQGVKGIRGKKYATLRTVPSGGARHAFETYLIVQNCHELMSGLYHYLPLSHQLEYLKPIDNLKETVSLSLCGQSWAGKADVVFYWTCMPERAEWRYGIAAHRPALIDVGHVGQNLYLSCTALNLGVCAIAAFDNDYTNKLLDIDGDNEFVVYTAPVGTIAQENQAEEDSFYQFVKDQGL